MALGTLNLALHHEHLLLGTTPKERYPFILMELIVATGTTKSNAAISLAPIVLEGLKGEQACVLLQVHAHPRDAKMLEEECVTIVRHALFESDGESWHRLDGALKEINGLFKGFLASGSVSDIHAIISFVDREQSIHLSQAGRGEGYLVRNGVASQVTEVTKGKTVPMFIHIASGELEAGDTIILGCIPCSTCAAGIAPHRGLARTHRAVGS